MIMIQYVLRGTFIILRSLLPALAIYVVYYGCMYLLKKKRDIRQVIHEYLFVAYLVVLGNITGIFSNGISFKAVMQGEIMKPNLVPFVNESFNLIVLNIILFIPLGILLPMVLKKFNWNYIKIFLVALILTLTIESVQFFSGRCADIDDIVMNVFGAFIGYTAYSFIMRNKKLKNCRNICRE